MGKKPKTKAHTQEVSEKPAQDVSLTPVLAVSQPSSAPKKKQNKKKKAKKEAKPEIVASPTDAQDTTSTDQPQKKNETPVKTDMKKKPKRGLRGKKRAAFLAAKQKEANQVVTAEHVVRGWERGIVLNEPMLMLVIACLSKANISHI